MIDSSLKFDFDWLFRLTVTDGEGLQGSTFVNATVMKGKAVPSQCYCTPPNYEKALTL